MAAKVRELTIAASNDFERIQAIGRYVQNIKYVAIEMNLARGGGYQPHLSTDVFAKQYGDCKDKANLMRALLRLEGINSYLVSIYSGDRDRVRPEWPSPQQFNHAIIAIHVKEDVSTPSVLVHPLLGRLLFFDPTDTSTALGGLPDHERGSFALVIAGKQGGIVRTPAAPPETNRTDVVIRATLGEDGALEAELQNQARGQSAANIRRIYASVQPADFQKQIESWLSESANEVNISQLEAKDAFDAGQFSLDLAFKAPSYAQTMQNA